jgi:NTE family protein
MDVWVLQGGGAKAARQAGFLYALHEAGLACGHVAGVSAGALNAVLVAMGTWSMMDSVWHTVRQEDIYHRYGALRVGLRLATGATGAYDNTPLRALLSRLVKAEAFQIPATVGYVDLRTGAYREATFGPDSPAADLADFLDKVHASATMPLVWEYLVAGKGDAEEWRVDGGLRNMTPAGDAIKLGADRVIGVLCSPLDVAALPKKPANALETALRVLDIIMNEIARTDFATAEDWNRAIRQVGPGVLLRRDGTPKRVVPTYLFPPVQDQGDTLDFSAATLKQRWDSGLADGSAAAGLLTTAA